MTLPRHITIGGKRVSVRLVRGLGNLGEYHHDAAEIRIRSGLTINDKISTLRHEMMHAALAISGVSFARRIDEECVVRCMDEIFFPSWDRLQHKLKTC